MMSGTFQGRPLGELPVIDNPPRACRGSRWQRTMPDGTAIEGRCDNVWFIPEGRVLDIWWVGPDGSKTLEQGFVPAAASDPE